jgi:hypothetical protein
MMKEAVSKHFKHMSDVRYNTRKHLGTYHKHGNKVSTRLTGVGRGVGSGVGAGVGLDVGAWKKQQEEPQYECFLECAFNMSACSI